MLNLSLAVAVTISRQISKIYFVRRDKIEVDNLRTPRNNQRVGLSFLKTPLEADISFNRLG